MLEFLRESLENCPIVKRGEYNYFIHPISDGVPAINPDLIDEIVSMISTTVDICSADYILTIEAMGIPTAAVLSYRTDIPLNIVRKRSYQLPGEVEISQNTGYSKDQKLYINGVKRGDKVIIVDDVISTGGTMFPLVETLLKMGVEILDVVIIIGRGSGFLRIYELGIEPIILAHINVNERGVVIEQMYGD